MNVGAMRRFVNEIMQESFAHMTRMRQVPPGPPIDLTGEGSDAASDVVDGGEASPQSTNLVSSTEASPEPMSSGPIDLTVEDSDSDGAPAAPDTTRLSNHSASRRGTKRGASASSSSSGSAPSRARRRRRTSSSVEAKEPPDALDKSSTSNKASKSAAGDGSDAKASSTNRLSSNEESTSNAQLLGMLKEKIVCPICQHTVGESKSPLASTACGHLYCMKCIRKAVRISKRCPTCRKQLRLRDIHRLYF